MVANIRGYTPNYNFKLINFDTPRWHTLEYANWSQLDSMLLAVGTPPIRGEWLNNTAYLIGDRVFDAQSSQLYRCLVGHTSTTTGTFAEDRAAHPSYWMLQSAGVPVYRDAWLAGAAYVLGDIVKVNNYTYYLCVDSHTSSSTFPPDAANWTLVFDATATVTDSQAAATAAAASASAASSSESNAATSETNADASEAAASTSASSAALSASNASNSATTASTAATNAANSAATAADQAAALTGTSTTSNAITLGSKSFTTQAGKQFNVGNWMTIVDAANPTANQMGGLITAYSGTTLTVNVLRVLGSGTIANWNLYISGSVGVDGTPGAPGTTTVTVSDTPPMGAPDGTMWWESDSGLLYVRYNDGNSTQWVIAAPQPDISAFLLKSGDTMTGDLTINKASPSIFLNTTGVQGAALFAKNSGASRWTVAFMDASPESGANAGSNFTIYNYDDSGTVLGSPFVINRKSGLIAVAADPIDALGVATKQYVDNRAVVLRNYIAGLRLQYTGATTFNVYAGQAASDDNTVMMTRPGNLAKTTAAWVAGNGGSLDTGTIGVGNWYHVFLIQRLDTGNTDILISLSLTSPTMPANYTKRRRIGTLLHNGGVLTSFLQDGDYFYWSVPFNTPTAIATTPTLRGVYVPTGVSVVAMLNVNFNFGGSTDLQMYHWNPALGGGAINQGRLGNIMGLTSTTGIAGSMQVRTDVNGQIYNYCNLVPASYTGYTEGYIDNRGKDA